MALPNTRCELWVLWTGNQFLGGLWTGKQFLGVLWTGKQFLGGLWTGKQFLGVLWTGKQFLLHQWHTPCYMDIIRDSEIVFDTIIRI